MILALCVAARPTNAATEFQGGDLNLATNWSNGLPAAGNPGTIATDGSNGTTVFDFGSTSVVDQTAGTITAADGFNLTAGTWNLHDGAFLTRYFLSNGASTTLHLRGGTVALSDVAGNQHVGAANGGTFLVSGSAVIDAGEATQPLQIDGTVGIAADWTGSWTYGTHRNNDWRDLFVAGSVRFDGQVLDTAEFDERFTVTNGGRTLVPLNDSDIARFPTPADGAGGVPVPPPLEWSAPTTYEATAYEVYLGPDPDVRANPRVTVSESSFTPTSDLAWDTTYHWVVDALDGTTLHPGTPWSFTTGADPASPYDRLSDLANYNVAWSSPSSDSAGSMPIGNGDLGANVWVEGDGDLMLLLSKTDAWSDTGRLVKLGRVRIRMTPNPFASGLPFLQTLNLPNGEILITAGAAGGTTSFRVWADAHHPAIHIEADGDIARDWQADLELWRTAPRSFVDNDELASAYGARFGPEPLVIQPDTVVGGLTDRLTWYHRNIDSVWADTLDVQDLDHLIPEMDDPLLDRTFGGALLTDGGFSTTTDTRLESDAPRNSARFSIVAHTAVTPTAADWLSALEAEIAAIEAVAPPDRRNAHVAWWENFWQRHWMVVRDSGAGTVSGSDPYVVTRGYILQRFMQACAGRGGAPIKFNGSIFTVDATSSYDADYRRWGPCYWWQNTRLPYWTMTMSGDLDLMDPLFEMYREALPLARERVQTWYGHAGAYFPETMYFWGTWNNDNYGWDRSGKTPGRSDNAYIRWEWQSGLELVQMMIERYLVAPDEDFATGTLMPLAVEIIDLYDLRYPRDPDGEIRFTPANSLETYHEGTENPAPEIAGLRRVLTELLALPEDLSTPVRRSQWSRLLGELPPLPRRDRNGQPALSPAEVIVGSRKNFEAPELYAVFPYGLYHVGKPELALADWTYGNREVPVPNGWGQDVIFAAMLGRTEEARSNVVRRFRTTHTGSRFPAMWGPNYDWIPDQCHGGSTMIALQKMLLLEDGDRLLLFPGWPADWDLDFKVHARGDTVIEGRLKDGEITRLHVTPADRYDDIENAIGTLPPQTNLWQFWRLNTPGAGGDPLDNGDGDPFVDLLEYALGGDPSDPTTPEAMRIARLGPSGDFRIAFTRPRGLTDITYRLQQSGTLASGSWQTVATPPLVEDLGDGTERVSWNLPGADTRFFRLQVVLV